ncbi:MAG TPA: sigma-70 family RNA polymerase sigma factor [Acidimicrobiales bacterium]|nr:sigma-70 family RNA polymerase sigma factor [Acidimicrobiales bacterium]
MQQVWDLENKLDDDLVAEIAAASEGALAEIYRRYGRAIYATARRLLGDNALAEDIVQDVMVRLWDRPLAFDPRRGTLRTFLLVLARNRCIDVLRSGRSRQARERSGYDVMIDVRAVDERLAHEEDVVGVSRALDQLSAPQRQVIELAYFDGLTYRHIAKLLDLPEGTVKSRIRLGLARLRTAVADDATVQTDGLPV